MALANPFNSVMGMFSRDIGIDLGTANTLVLVRGKGIVINEPSVVAIDAKTKRPLAVGADAKRMVGRTPANIVAVRPLKDGVISDFDVTELMLHYFIRKVHERFTIVPKPRVVIGIPSGVTEVERRAVHDAAIEAGAREAHLIEEPMAAAIGAGLPITEPAGCMIVDIGGGTTEVAVISLRSEAGAREAHLIEEPMAAAIGAGLPITEPAGCMIVDIGGGTTEVAVISLGGIVVARSIRIAGDEMDMNIAMYMRQRHNLLIGERMAEEVKIAAGNAYYGLNGRTPDQRVVVRGRDLVTGLPAELEVGGDGIREAIAISVNAIVDAVTDTIEETPPELVADMMARGITLAGGGSLLPGLADLLSRRTKMQVHLAEDPLGCVVRGTGKVLNELEVLRKVLVDQHSGRPLYRR